MMRMINGLQSTRLGSSYRGLSIVPPFLSIRRLQSTQEYPPSVLDAFRRSGHLRATLSPLVAANLGNDRVVEGLPSHGKFLDLDAAYCGSIGYEFLHCTTVAEREWFLAEIEGTSISSSLTPSAERNAAVLMLRGAEIESFMARRYPGLKQYGGSGTESLLPCVETIITATGASGVSRVVIGQAHRGRLALLVALLNYPARKLFWKLDGNDEIPYTVPGLDDVASHLYVSTRFNNNVRVSLLPNPSHLEAVNPVVMGRVRASQDEGEKAISLLIHGDGAFSGQGVVAECFAASKTPSFDVNGTLHIVTNNLLAFTAPGSVGRSSTYATDFAKSVNAPVLHVNGEDIGAVLRAATLACAYRTKFKRDIVIDLIGYRRSGHNEVDEPAFTSPKLYDEIKKRSPFAALYASNILGIEGAAAIVARTNNHFESEFALARGAASNAKGEAGARGAGSPLSTLGGSTGAGSGLSWSDNGTHVVGDGSAYGGAWKDMHPVLNASELLINLDTGEDIERLRRIGIESVTFPIGFNVHDRLLRGHVAPRLSALSKDKSLSPTIDWATAEALAFGVTLDEGNSVRLSGQDVERGTFSHRHAVVIDTETEARAYAFHNSAPNRFRVHSSLLSEEAVLGFEYGYSLQNPKNLVIWESQFGDFTNSAQVVVDTFIATGESKWLRSSGLVMLLPHGQDGAGPEHSSARIERFLQLCNGHAWVGANACIADDGKINSQNEPLNMVVAQPTTPSNYFHLLRRQLKRKFRKPLIIATPKQLLRLSEATSSLASFVPGTHFQPLLNDDKISNTVNDSLIHRVILCSGKIFYELDAARRAAKLSSSIALIRIEEIAPWPTALLDVQLSRYSKAKSVVWVQDEPANAGAWAWARMHLPSNVTYVGRCAHATAAVGLKKRFSKSQSSVIDLALTISN